MANEDNVDPLVGKTINDRFQVTSLIARGGMGKVYRGKQMPLGRDCAVKVLSVKKGEVDEDFEKRFGKGPHTVARIIAPQAKQERPWVYLEPNPDLGLTLEGANWFRAAK